jgi:hypothetical protein
MDDFKYAQFGTFYYIMNQALNPKLTIELVPSSCWFLNVRSSVNPKDWDKIRKLYAKAADNKCQICGGRGPKWPVECHDKIQKLAGMISLCPKCHEVKHFGFARVKGREKVAINHLAKINQWSEAVAKQYVIDSFRIWERRSKTPWTLDISFLQTLGVAVLEK